MENRKLLILFVLLFCSISLYSNNNVDSLKNLLSEEKNPETQIELLHELYTQYLTIDLDSAIFHIEIALEIAKEYNLTTDIALCLKLRGNAYLHKEYYNLALDNYQKALNIHKGEGNKLGVAHILNNIAIIYKRTEKYELALESFKEVSAMHREIDNEKGALLLYGNIGVIYSSIQQYDSAIYCLNTVLSEYEYLSLEDSVFLTQHLNNLGFAYYCKNEYEAALDYYLKAISIAENSKHPRNLALYYNNIGRVYYSTETYNLALIYFNKSLAIAIDNDMMSMTMHNYKNLNEVYNKTEDYKKSLEYLELHLVLNDSIHSIDNEILTEELRLIYDIGEKEKEMDLLEIEKEKEIQILERNKQLTAIKQYVLIVAIIAIALFSLLLISRFKSQRKVYKLDIEKRKLKNEFLKKDIDYKSNQLTDFALSIIQRNTYLHKINDQFKKIKNKANQEVFQDIIEAQHNIRLAINITEDRKEFSVKVESINQFFFNALEVKYPELTKNEKQIAALLRINLSSKEIASLQNVETKSIENYRYKIRKKMNLKPDDDLCTFLTSISLEENSHKEKNA